MITSEIGIGDFSLDPSVLVTFEDPNHFYANYLLLSTFLGKNTPQKHSVNFYRECLTCSQHMGIPTEPEFEVIWWGEEDKSFGATFLAVWTAQCYFRTNYVLVKLMGCHWTEFFSL